MFDLRETFAPEDVIDISHTLNYGFVNRYSSNYTIILTSNGKIEYCICDNVKVNIDKFNDMYNLLKDTPTKIMVDNIDSVKLILSLFDMVTYSMICLIVVDQVNEVGGFISYFSPMGITPENAIRDLFGVKLTDSHYSFVINYAKSMLGNKFADHKVVASSSRSTTLAGLSVSLRGDGVVVEGKELKL